MRRIWSVVVAVLFGALLVNFAVTRVSAVDFSADLTETQGEKVMKGKIHVMGAGYCMELEQEGEQFRVVANPAEKTTTLIRPGITEYRVLQNDDFMVRMNDPFTAYTYMLQYGEEVAAGTETVGGYECDKFQIVRDENPLMIKWVSKKLGFPIKIMTPGEPPNTVELSNISEGTPSAALFEIPAGFRAWVDPESLPVDPPAWAGEIESAPVVTVPFERVMKVGEMVRVKIEPGKSLAVKGTPESDAKARGLAIPFKGINPVKEESYFNNFADKGTLCDRRHEVSGEADEFVIRMYEGSANVVAKWIPMFEKTASAGEEVRYPVSGDDHITVRIINLSEGKATASFSYWAGGQPMSEEEIGPAKYRMIELENPWSVDAITRKALGDEMVIKVEEGKMQIKLGQFDSFEF